MSDVPSANIDDSGDVPQGVESGVECWQPMAPLQLTPKNDDATTRHDG